MSRQPEPHAPRDALFNAPFLDGFGRWPVAYISSGGADMDDIVAVADAVGDGDESAFYDAWVAAGDAKAADAESVLAAGHRASVRRGHRRLL